MSDVKKRNAAIMAGLLLLVLSVVLALSFLKAADRLTNAEIAKLREQYPVCGKDIPLGADVKRATLDECKERSDSFVYGEVIGNAKYYQVSVDLEDDELQGKMKANGMDNTHEFYEYTISVIDDTQGRYTPDSQITISANILLKDFNPLLRDGMRVIVPVIPDENVELRNYYTVYGMFYVTNDGYALSAYEEEPNTGSILSGERVEVLMERLQK